MPRPLYLDPTLQWQVKLDEGVALNVSAPGRARSLYPLQRLARVVCGKHSQWHTEALLACLEAGVPVIFHDSRGDAVAWCFGGRRREATLGQLLREGLGRPEWPERFGLWAGAAQRREMLGALRQLGLRTARLDAAHVRALLCNQHRRRLGQPAGPWLRALQQATAGLACELLARSVGDGALLAYAQPGLHLPRELARLLEWRQHLILHGRPAADLRALAPGRYAAAALEQCGAMLHRACGELLGDLELQLREWLL
jgi:hypothetical protein